MATLNKRNGNSISVTIPMAIIKALCLRPGMNVKIRIQRMPARAIDQNQEEGQRWTLN